MIEFKSFPKLSRLSRPVVVTEKIDGTNAQIYIRPHQGNHPPPYLAAEVTHEGQPYEIFAGSRTRVITPQSDNFGFAAWVYKNAQELVKLGPGRHFGEWWGQGIQRNYGLKEKRFSLFNVEKWKDNRPECCHVVPVLGELEELNINSIRGAMLILMETGSIAAPGFMNPEGIVVFHAHSGAMFKMTPDDQAKGRVDG